MPIPRPSTPWFGRQDELARLHDRLERPGTVAVLGPGGAGKTRIVAEATAHREEVLFVDLARARSAADLLDWTGGVLGLQGAADAARIGRAIAARRRPVVILDNVEAIAPQASEVMSALAGAAPEATFVATSRRRLAAAWELDLGPLELADAVALFRARATGEHEEDSVREVIRRLDALPLALEMAAARTRVLSVAELVHRLDNTFLRRPDDPRRATLEQAVRWSWDLLSDDERACLMQVAVFRGGFDLAAAEVVVDVPDVADVLDSLLDHYLLRRTAHAPEVRMAPYEAVRVLAEAELARSGTAPAVERRHAEHYVDRCRVQARAVRLGWGEVHLARLRAEVPNLAAICERWTEREPQLALGAAEAWVEVRFAEPASEQLRAMQRLVDTTTGHERARALCVRGRLRIALGAPEAADFEEAAATFEREGDSRRGADATRLLAVAQLRTDVEIAAHTAARAVELADGLGEADLRSIARVVAAQLVRARGDAQGARVLNEAALDLARSSGDRAMEAWAMVGLADNLIPLEGLVAAEPWASAAYTTAQGTGDPGCLAAATERLSGVYADLGRHEEALALADVLARADAARGLLNAEAVHTGRIAHILLDRGESALAVSKLRQALAATLATGDMRKAMFSSLHLGIALLVDGDAQGALQELRRTATLAAETGAGPVCRPVEEYRALACAVLGEEPSGEDRDELEIIAIRAARRGARSEAQRLLDSRRAEASDSVNWRIRLRVVERVLAELPPASVLRIVVRYDTVHIHRPSDPAPLVLAGIYARLVSELASMGGLAPWLVVAREIWRELADEAQLRVRWDKALSRLRRVLQEAGVRPDLVRPDGRGNVELVLHSGDSVVEG
jgi:predicted ATPase/tetratricopeptide (TPR) repeat protein